MFIMSFDLKLSVQQESQNLSPQQKKLNRLIEQIEQQKQELLLWKNAQQDIQSYIYRKLVPIYADLHAIWFEQMQALWNSLSRFDLTRTDAAQVDGKIQSLTRQLKDSNLLNQIQVEEVDKLYNYYFQATEYEQIKKNKRGQYSTDHCSEPEADKTEVVDDEIYEYDFTEYNFEEPNSDQYRYAREQVKLKSQQDKQAQAEKMVNQSLKSVYLKIASIIHPDREPDESKKAEKTELLQRANEAYEQEDLFFLLKLQLEVEQSKHGSNKLSTEQVKFYQQALEAQSQSLKKQIQELVDSLVWSNKAKIAVQKSKGQLNITDLYKQIDVDVSAIKYQLKAEKQRLMYMGKESGLEMLLEHGVL